MSLVTPDFSHLTTDDLNHVYEPSEDTFLLIDAIEADLKILSLIEPTNCLEVGSGSGVVISALGMYFGNKCNYFATDINPKACRITEKTGLINKVNIKSVVSDLASNIESELQGKVDVLLFNPPYVVTPTEEVGTGDLEYTWAGGVNGREVMDRFFPCVSNLLSPKGYFYLVVLKENGIEEIFEIMKKFGLHGKCVLNRKCRSENLSILRFNFMKNDI